MLKELRIQDFAIIDKIRLDLSSGFVVFTGETGAGKSIIVDAVDLLLGARADSTVVRTGADVAIVEGDFVVEPAVQQDVASILEREGLLDDAAFVTLGREIRREGRSICRVNGRTVSLGLLRELGELLVDVHGQSEHLSLLRVREHLNLLDRFARVEQPRHEFGVLFHQLTETRRELKDLQQLEQEAARKADMLAFQINEIDAAALRQGEDQALVEERTRLANAEQLATLAEVVISAIDEGAQGEPTARDSLGRAVQALGELAKIDATMEGERLEGQALVEQLGELSRRLRVYRERIEFSPQRLDEVEERLALIRSLQRKYGASIEAVQAYHQRAKAELETITYAGERMADLEAQEQALLQQMAGLGERLSAERREAGGQLASAIVGELGELGMEGARFSTEITWQEGADGALIGEKRYTFGPGGLDQVEFLVSPNPGEDLKPLAKIASGGETSRMMLGLKGVLARADRVPTLIFDEIDQGIGGRVGAVVGRKLWRLAREHHVVCITHLPQLAAHGDQHFKVEKKVEKGRTVTRVHELSGEERAVELAQMLGGRTQSNLSSARELLSQAEVEKDQAPGSR